MSLKNDLYTYRVTWSEEDQEYLALCSEFPSLSWLAESQELALKGIRELVSDTIKDMEANEETNTSSIFRQEVQWQIHGSNSAGIA